MTERPPPSPPDACARRCDGCGYRLGLSQARCPECASAASTWILSGHGPSPESGPLGAGSQHRPWYGLNVGVPIGYGLLFLTTASALRQGFVSLSAGGAGNAVAPVLFLIAILAGALLYFLVRSRIRARHKALNWELSQGVVRVTSDSPAWPHFPLHEITDVSLHHDPKRELVHIALFWARPSPGLRIELHIACSEPERADALRGLLVGLIREARNG